MRAPAIFCFLSVLAADASAKPTACAHATRWTSEAILTLAVVRDGRVERDRGQCPEPGGFHATGVRWRAIDRWGRTTGIVENVDDPQRGTVFVTVSGTRGVGVFVDPAWSPPPSAEWTPPSSVRSDLLRWVARKRLARGDLDVAFFQAAGERLAAVAGKDAVLVARRDAKGKWRRIYRESQAARWPLFALRAVVDMNGDGVPEVIYHYNEYADGRGHEVVLGARAGTWRELSDNFDDGP